MNMMNKSAKFHKDSSYQWIFRPFKILGRVSLSGIWFLTTQSETSKLKMLSSTKDVVFSVSWHADVTCMHAECVTRGYYQFDLIAK